MSLFRLFSGGSSDIEVTAGGTGGQRRSGRGQGGRGTRSGMSGDSNGAGSLLSEDVGDVVGMEISIPESAVVEDWNNFSSIANIDCECYLPASTEPFWRRDDNVVGVEAEGDVSLHLGPEFDGGEDLEWYSWAGNEAAYCQAATESHNGSAGGGAAGAAPPISEREPGARANLLSLPIKLLMKVWVSSALMKPSALISNLIHAFSKS